VVVPPPLELDVELEPLVVPPLEPVLHEVYVPLSPLHGSVDEQPPPAARLQ
jgi:hypothetical protein